jgi:hypothetical protein
MILGIAMLGGWQRTVLLQGWLGSACVAFALIAAVPRVLWALFFMFFVLWGAVVCVVTTTHVFPEVF